MCFAAHACDTCVLLHSCSTYRGPAALLARSLASGDCLVVGMLWEWRLQLTLRPRVLPHARLTMRRAPTLGILTTGIHPEEANLYESLLHVAETANLRARSLEKTSSSAPGLNQMPHSGRYDSIRALRCSLVPQM